MRYIKQFGKQPKKQKFFLKNLKKKISTFLVKIKSQNSLLYRKLAFYLSNYIVIEKRISKLKNLLKKEELKLFKLKKKTQKYVNPILKNSNLKESHILLNQKVNLLLDDIKKKKFDTNTDINELLILINNAKFAKKNIDFKTHLPTLLVLLDKLHKLLK